MQRFVCFVFTLVVIIGLRLDGSATEKINKIITPEFTASRLDDQVLVYCKARYFSLKYSIPLSICYPNEWINNFTFSKLQKPCPSLKNTIIVHRPEDIAYNTSQDTLFKVSYFCTLPDQHDANRYAGDEFDFLHKKMFEINTLYTCLRNDLQPSTPIQLPALPKDFFTIAVHLRKGGGFDGPLFSQQLFRATLKNRSLSRNIDDYADKKWPNKFPPEQFFIDQIKRISTLLSDTKLLITIFTDDTNTHKVVQRWEPLLVHYKNIKFCCKNHTGWQEATMENLCDMARYDCIIRGSSRFSGVAVLMGNHKLIVSAGKKHWEGNKLIVDQAFYQFCNHKKSTINQYFYEETDYSTIKDAVTAVLLE